MGKRKKSPREILFEIYRAAYAVSTPSADFDELVRTAEVDEFGNKKIEYEKYFISQEVYDEIVHSILGKYKLSDYDRKGIKEVAYLGCGPTFKNDD